MRRFDHWARNVFERSVDRQENERRVDVSQHYDDGERAVEQSADGLVRDVEIFQKSVEDAVAAENRFPGIAAYEIAHPERNYHELIEQLFARDLSICRRALHILGDQLARPIPDEEAYNIVGILRQVDILILDIK